MLDPRDYKKILHSCFDYPVYDRHKNIGWCATCDPDAKRKERGYCGPGETSKEEEAPIIYPNSTNWGFCDPKCLDRNDDEKVIQARTQELLIKSLKSNCVTTIYNVPE